MSLEKGWWMSWFENTHTHADTQTSAPFSLIVPQYQHGVSALIATSSRAGARVPGHNVTMPLHHHGCKHFIVGGVIRRRACVQKKKKKKCTECGKKKSCRRTMKEKSSAFWINQLKLIVECANIWQRWWMSGAVMWWNVFVSGELQKHHCHTSFNLVFPKRHSDTIVALYFVSGLAILPPGQV